MKAFALIGSPLGHSLSPEIHALISEISALPCTYALCLLEPDAVRPFILRMTDVGLDGLNVTIPYKPAAFACMDALSAEAEAVGAVNTVEVTPYGLVGHNTDCHGFSAMLAFAGIDAAGGPCAVLGSGGSARAVLAALAEAGAPEIVLVSRAPQDAANRFPGVRTASYEELKGIKGHLLVNCTPVGMHPAVDGCPVPEHVVGRFAAVADLVYNPRETRLTSAARRLGLKVADGLYMLAAQAVRAREIWHGAALGCEVEKEVYLRLDTALRRGT